MCTGRIGSKRHGSAEVWHAKSLRGCLHRVDVYIVRMSTSCECIWCECSAEMRHGKSPQRSHREVRSGSYAAHPPVFARRAPAMSTASEVDASRGHVSVVVSSPRANMSQCRKESFPDLLSRRARPISSFALHTRMHGASAQRGGRTVRWVGCTSSRKSCGAHRELWLPPKSLIAVIVNFERAIMLRSRTVRYAES